MEKKVMVNKTKQEERRKAGGRPATSEAIKDKAIIMYNENQNSVKAIAAECNISIKTLYRIIAERSK